MTPPDPKHAKTLTERSMKLASTAGRARHRIEMIGGQLVEVEIEEEEMSEVEVLAPVYAPPALDDAPSLPEDSAEPATPESFFGPELDTTAASDTDSTITFVQHAHPIVEDQPSPFAELSGLEPLGKPDHGPELAIIEEVKDPFFTWRGKPLGKAAQTAPGGVAQTAPAGIASTVPAPPAVAPEVSQPRPVKRPAQTISKSGINAQTWFGDTVQAALLAGASDVHVNLNGLKDTLHLRIRVDGQMEHYASLTGEDAQKVMGIFKASAEFASGGSYVPEEAIYSIQVDGEERKARAVLFRTQDAGDALVMRLPPRGDIRTLDELEFSDKNLALFRRLLLSANRMLLIAGPMGSGKTTTSHAGIMHVATAERSVWTVEDPVERKLPGLTQLEVDEENGAGFEKLLPALVRSDYDTLFLGEIRDKATAGAGVRQAKAGRQVISTIHANDNVTAVLRLIELAEDTPLSVMDAIKGVVSQRLVRRLNPDWDGEDAKAKYRGRVPIHEVLMMTDALVEAVMEEQPLSTIKRVAAEASASTFAEDAERLIETGVTDAAEINKVLGLDSTDDTAIKQEAADQ